MSAAIDQRHVWNLLVNLAGANDSDTDWVSFRQWFDRAFEKGGTEEYRFIGSLGFGGKFWLTRRGMHVSCYREDETSERLAAIEQTNEALASAWVSLTPPETPGGAGEGELRG